MGENPVARALSGVGRSARDILRFEALSRQQNLQAQQLESQERRALEGLRLQGERDVAAAQLQSAQEARRQAGQERAFGLQEEQLGLRRGELESAQQFRSQQLGLQRERLDLVDRQFEEQLRQNAFTRDLRRDEFEAAQRLNDLEIQVQTGILNQQEAALRLRNMTVPPSFALKLMGARGANPQEVAKGAVLLGSLEDSGVLTQTNQLHLGRLSVVLQAVRQLEQAVGVGAGVPTEEQKRDIAIKIFEAVGAGTEGIKDPNMFPLIMQSVDRTFAGPGATEAEAFRLQTRIEADRFLQDVLEQRGITDILSLPEDVQDQLRAQARQIGQQRAAQKLGISGPLAAPPAQEGPPPPQPQPGQLAPPVRRAPGQLSPLDPALQDPFIRRGFGLPPLR